VRTPIKLVIRDFMGLRDVEVEIEKTVLYGPNAGGKSRVIYALMNTIDRYGLIMYLSWEVGEAVKEVLKGNYDVIVGDTTIQVRGEDFKVVSPSGEFSGDYDAVFRHIVEAFESIGVREVAWVTDRGRVVTSVGGKPNLVRTMDIKDLLEEPGRVETVENLWRLFTSARKFYSDRAKVGDRWIPINMLSAGERKAMVLIYFAKFTDLLAVETFEGGLHIDTALDLISLLSDEARYVVLETHYGLVAGRALEHGWNVYYINSESNTWN